MAGTSEAQRANHYTTAPPPTDFRYISGKKRKNNMFLKKEHRQNPVKLAAQYRVHFARVNFFPVLIQKGLQKA